METQAEGANSGGQFRAFIAVEVADGERFAPVLHRLKQTGGDLKLVNTKNIHVTLKFLGSTAELLVPGIVGAMRKSVAGVEPFSIKFQGMGAFPNPNRISVVWAGIQNGDRLGSIAESLDEMLFALGFGRESRKFSPHLTLARLRGARNLDAVQKLVKENAGADFGDMRVGSILLKKSVLTPQGPLYSTVEEVPLG